jgi:hypothetical protein
VVDYMPGADNRLTEAIRNFTDPRLKYVKVRKAFVVPIACTIDQKGRGGESKDDCKYEL